MLARWTYDHKALFDDKVSHTHTHTHMPSHQSFHAFTLSTICETLTSISRLCWSWELELQFLESSSPVIPILLE